MYDYKEYREQIFTESGQRDFLKCRDNVNACLRISGAVRMMEATRGLTGLNWEHYAYVDRMVELGELREITEPNTSIQYRVFVNGKV